MNKFEKYIQKHIDILNKYDNFQHIDNAITSIIEALKKNYQFWFLVMEDLQQTHYIFQHSLLESFKKTEKH